MHPSLLPLDKVWSVAHSNVQGIFDFKENWLTIVLAPDLEEFSINKAPLLLSIIPIGLSLE